MKRFRRLAQHLPRARHNCKGETIIECLVSLTILILLLTGITAMINTSMRFSMMALQRSNNNQNGLNFVTSAVADAGLAVASEDEYTLTFTVYCAIDVGGAEVVVLDGEPVTVEDVTVTQMTGSVDTNFIAFEPLLPIDPP